MSDEERGSGIARSSLRVEVDDVDITLYCGAGQNWGQCRDVQLPDGQHRLVVKVKDERGNRAAATRRFSTLEKIPDTWAPWVTFEMLRPKLPDACYCPQWVYCGC